MTATKLKLINAALAELGNREIGDTGDAVEDARVMTRFYDDVVEDCLTAGSWNFAMETIQADADTGVTPSFGYGMVFAKPTDWLRTIAVSGDEYFSYPLTEYVDDVNYWSADLTPIYVRYVSNDTGLGLELTRWPRTFQRYVELELAYRTCERLTQNATKREAIEKIRDRARRNALGQDAMNQAQPQFPPPGSWTLSRRGRTGNDRGSRNKLIG